MAFHTACPITSRKICTCKLGFPPSLRSAEGLGKFLSDVEKIEALLKNPWPGKARDDEGVVQVRVPKLVIERDEDEEEAAEGEGGGGGGGDGVRAGEELSLSMLAKRRADMQRKAAEASMVTEDYVRKLESGIVPDTKKENIGEEHGLSNAQVVCRLCLSGANEGSVKAKKMLSCNNCSKKYHRSCLKVWSQHRDLFHWSSWTCPSCRVCEVCCKTGEANKLMFCKRCDGAYHCYCQQPSYKTVSSGPYLCPKHTRCHSCASTVPGNGSSVRWFLGYTCCDACGRLFVKGNYCPVCLKVYRDSETTPMVCCDKCERWVHCSCDGISDEMYMQFNANGNLQYECPACRNECYKVKDLEDAVKELWRRRDKADQYLTASLRAAAGLPTQEEIFSISPYSDDDDTEPVPSKHDGRSLKFSLKGIADKSSKKSKDPGEKSSKKYSKKKECKTPSIKRNPENMPDGHGDEQSVGYITGDNLYDGQSYGSGEPDGIYFPVAGSLADGVCSVNQASVLKHRYIDEVNAMSENNFAGPQTYRNKPHRFGDDSGKHDSKSKTTTGHKLVIHLGGRNINVANSPMSDGSSYQKEQDLTISNGSGDVGQQRANNQHLGGHDITSKSSDTKVGNINWSDHGKGSKLGKEGKIKIGKVNSEDLSHHPVSPVKTRVLLGKRSREGEAFSAADTTDSPVIKTKKVRNYLDGGVDESGDLNEDSRGPAASSQSYQDSKPFLKLKFKKPYLENQVSWTPPGKEEKIVKGQRSKRKRPSYLENPSSKDDKEVSHSYEDNIMSEIMDANWIIQKLGKDSIGKRVEVHQASNNSWQKGTVTEVFEGTSVVSVATDNGEAKNVDLSKQGIRFVQQKQKR